MMDDGDGGGKCDRKCLDNLNKKDKKDKDKKDTNPSCADDPNCFSRTQADIIFMSNFLTGAAAVEGLASAFFISVGLSLFSIGDIPHGIVSVFIGAELLVDGIDSMSTSEYLKTIAQNTKPGGVVEFHKEESVLKTGYYIDGQYATQDAYMPITRIAMEWFAWEP